MRNGLASVAWLAERLGQPNLRVVDATWFLPSSPFASPVAARAAHAAARVPGSTFWDLDEVSDAAAAPSTPHNLPTPAQFAAEARRHGIAPDTRVVCYDQLGVFSAPRLWHTLRAFGVEAAVLDGGLPAWAAAGHAVERGEPAVEPAAAPAADFAYSGELQWRLGDVEAWLASDRTVQLVDARLSWRVLQAQAAGAVTLGDGYDVCRVRDAVLVDADGDAPPALVLAPELPDAAPPAAGPRPPRLWLSAKDVVLPALKARLAAEGVAAAFRAGALVCAGTVVVRKTVDDRGAGRIVVDGPLCDEYYTVSRIVRDAFALV